MYGYQKGKSSTQAAVQGQKQHTGCKTGFCLGLYILSGCVIEGREVVQVPSVQLMAEPSSGGPKERAGNEAELPQNLLVTDIRLPHSHAAGAGSESGAVHHAAAAAVLVHLLWYHRRLLRQVAPVTHKVHTVTMRSHKRVA